LNLLLDEMYPPAIADQLRRRGYDVNAVAARPELRTMSDAQFFDLAVQERRAVATENVADYTLIADQYDHRMIPHYGVVFVDPRKFERGNARTVGWMVTALHRLLREHPEADPTGLRYWL
jgi:hypothetical protein